MEKKKRNIPEYQMPDSEKDGIGIIAYNDYVYATYDIYAPHRDEHYLLMAFFRGSYKAVIDFDNINIEISKPFIALITPGQVHHVVEANNSKGYSVSFNAELMPVELKSILETYFLQEKLYLGNSSLMRNIRAIMEMLIRQKQKENSSHLSVSHHLLHSLLALIAADIDILEDISKGNRAKQIERDFQRLLQIHFKEWKKPADYAKALYITVSHLNDTIKKNTGSPVSAQIQRYIVTEAKRMLYYTNNNIQEIAYELGYEDTAYFTRMFRKIAGMPPAAFRKKFRD